MLKEIVEFSKELEQQGIYKLIEKENEENESIPQIIKITLNLENEFIVSHNLKVIDDKDEEKQLYELYSKYTRPFAKMNNKELKMLFYSGYFNTEANIFFKSSKTDNKN